MTEEQERYNDTGSDSETGSLPDTDNIWKENDEDSSFESDGSVQNSMSTDSESDVELGTGMYILPQSDKTYLTDEDIAGLFLKEINYAKKDIRKIWKKISARGAAEIFRFAAMV